MGRSNRVLLPDAATKAKLEGCRAQKIETQRTTTEAAIIRRGWEGMGGLLARRVDASLKESRGYDGGAQETWFVRRGPQQYLAWAKCCMFCAILVSVSTRYLPPLTARVQNPTSYYRTNTLFASDQQPPPLTPHLRRSSEDRPHLD